MEEKEKQSKEKNGKNGYYELLKYPVVTLCIVVGIVCLSKFTGIDFKNLTKISASGLEFANQQTEKALVGVNDSLVAMQTKIASIEDFLVNKGDDKSKSVSGGSEYLTTPSRSVANKGQLAVATLSPVSHLKQTEVINNSIAALSYVDANKNTKLSGKTGYIWIGSYNNGKWENELPFENIGSGLDAKTIAPSSIPKREYVLSQNLKLRVDLPKTADDTKSQLGIIPSGTPVSLKFIVQGSDSQFWAEVEVLK